MPTGRKPNKKTTYKPALNMCFNESGVCHFAEKESLKEISVLRIGNQWYKSRLHKAQAR
jgi:hypothetical protein